MNVSATDLLAPTVRALAAKKGMNIAVLDVRNLSGITDYYVLVSGMSTPHVKALAEAVHDVLKTHGVYAYRMSGKPESGWVAVDGIDLVIHIMSESARRYYDIERLWAEAPRLPVDETAE